MNSRINTKTVMNTGKVAGASMLAILIAQSLHLDFAVSAGIIAILTIQPTKKETIRTAAGRLLAFIGALVIAYLCFRVFGFRLAGFFCYLVFFILFCQCFRWYHAIAMDSVLISHFLTFSNMGWGAVANEAGIFFIGTVMGILVNLHLHKNTGYMEQLKTETDEQIKRALHRMSERILDKNLSGYDGKCFQELDRSIRKAKNIAETNFLNQFGNKDTKDMEYISMREQQIHVLYEMYKRVRNIRTKPLTARTISQFLEKMSAVYHRENSGQELLKDFYRMDESMKSLPLPVERAEFEDRAELYTLLRYMEEFILIKKDFCSGSAGAGICRIDRG